MVSETPLAVVPRRLFLSSDLTRVEMRIPSKKISESFGTLRSLFCLVSSI